MPTDSERAAWGYPPSPHILVYWNHDFTRKLPAKYS